MPAILLVAFGLRLWAASSASVLHPDEVYQYLEPAHRLLSGDGVITWEWRAGIRSWLLPVLFTPWAVVSDALGWAPMFAPRIAAALASLMIVGSAALLGARYSAMHGLFAAAVTAIWYDLVQFGAHTLAEPIATAAILAASVPLSRRDAQRGALIAAGALLTFAILMRPHYAPACLVLVAVTRGAALRADWGPMIRGVAGVAALAAAVDMASGAAPFAWIMRNADLNLTGGIAARFGVHAPLAYFDWLWARWGWWSGPFAFALLCGYRAAPGLFWAAVTTLALHSLIGHKELRFIFLAIAVATVLAAIGTARIVATVRARWPQASPAVGGLALLLWAVASLSVASSQAARDERGRGGAGMASFAALNADASACGVALHRLWFDQVPGRIELRPDIALAMFDDRDDAVRERGGVAAALRQNDRSFDRILAWQADEATIPQAYRRDRCVPGDGGALCTYSRPGECSKDPGAFGINRVLERLPA